MDAPSWSLQDAKNRFSAVVAAALKGTPQAVTKRGKPAVIVMSVSEYQRLVRRLAVDTPSFVEHLLRVPKDEGAIPRARARPRAVEF